VCDWSTSSRSFSTRVRQDSTLLGKQAISKRCPCLRSRTTATLVRRFCPTGCTSVRDISGGGNPKPSLCLGPTEKEGWKAVRRWDFSLLFSSWKKGRCFAFAFSRLCPFLRKGPQRNVEFRLQMELNVPEVVMCLSDFFFTFF
jgi:hypothetical protein